MKRYFFDRDQSRHWYMTNDVNRIEWDSQWKEKNDYEDAWTGRDRARVLNSEGAD